MDKPLSFHFTQVYDDKAVWTYTDHAVELYPDAHPIFHSDPGFQYTNATFHQKLTDAGLTQSMSRVGKCPDNGPMEGFWGILKRERYYGMKFTGREELIAMITSYGILQQQTLPA